MFSKITTQSNNIPNSQVAQNHTLKISQKQRMQIQKRFGLKQVASKDQVVKELQKQFYQTLISDLLTQKASQIQWCLKHKLKSPVFQFCRQSTQSYDYDLQQIEELQDPIHNIPQTKNQTIKILGIINLLDQLKKFGKENIVSQFQQIKSTQQVILLSFQDIEEKDVDEAINEFMNFLRKEKYNPILVEPLFYFQKNYLQFKKEKRLATSLVRYLILEGQFKGYDRELFKKIVIQKVSQKISLEMVNVKQNEVKAIEDILLFFFDSKHTIQNGKISFSQKDRNAALFTNFVLSLTNNKRMICFQT